MRIDNFLTFAAIVCLFASCTITGKVARRHTVAAIDHIAKPRAATQAKSAEEPAAPQKGYVEFVDKDSVTHYFIPTEDDGIGTLRLNPAVIIAPSRTIPERNGKVELEFVVTLPKELMGSCREVEIIPVLHNNSENIPLQKLSIRGAFFDKVQQRNYWQYDRYLNLFNPGGIGREWAYSRFIHHPYPESTRLDSIAQGKSGVTYFYTQDVPTADATGNKLCITLQGRVAALDHSEYRFPLSDTLTYNISSMLQFADITTRYVTRVIEKYAVVNDRNYLNFPANKSVIIDSLGDNSAQLNHIENLMDEILNQHEFYVDNITLTASASPEGSARKNDALARSRAHSLCSRLAARFSGHGIDTLLTVRSIGEDWAELARLIADDNHVENRAKIVELIEKEINSQGVKNIHGDDFLRSKNNLIREKNNHEIPKINNPDNLENYIKSNFPRDYKYIFATIYPKLRAVNFTYNLRRVGMIKDTIHTTVPDTIYARGVTLLHARKYRDALAILGGFHDRNAAICHLSLGQDFNAYQILKTLPEHSTRDYLLAITCSRLAQNDEALAYMLNEKSGANSPASKSSDACCNFDSTDIPHLKHELESEALRCLKRAIELDPNLEFRINLDPEISPLKNLLKHESTN